MSVLPPGVPTTFGSPDDGDDAEDRLDVSLSGPTPPAPPPPEPARPRRPWRGGHPLRWKWAALAMACVLVAGTAFVVGTRAPGPSEPSPTPAETLDVAQGTLPEPSYGSAPAPSNAKWTSADVPPLAPIATLAASKTQPAGIARDAVFTLRSLRGTAATTLAKGLSAEPAVAFKVARGRDASTATVTPAAPLRGGIAYRLTLRAPDGSLGGSWLFRVEGPPTVVSTTPYPNATGVPVDTGIELTFDQDGVGSIEPFFSISPPVRGRFERHDRTWVFVPAADLEHATIYTATVRKGVPLAGSSLTLQTDVVIPFETAPAADPIGPTQLDASFVGDLFESRVADAPVLPMDVEHAWNSDQRETTEIDVVVHRLSGLPAAVDALAVLRGDPGWAALSDAGLVRTAGLPVVLRTTLQIRSQETKGSRESYVVLPILDAGWYLVQRASSGRDQQLVLQVTDVSAFLQQSSTKSVLWANDVSTGLPVAGGVLWTADGRRVATTSVDGTALATLPAADYFVVTAPDGGTPGSATPGRALVIPLYLAPAVEEACTYWRSPSNARHWTLLETDRSLYRTTDEIDAWGLVKRRDGGTPANVELRLIHDTSGGCLTPAEVAADAILRIPVTLGGRTGTFATRVPIESLPVGWYGLELWADGTLVGQSGLQVNEIRKPSYTISSSVDRHVLVDGDEMVATVATSFFDGTPAPSLGLHLYGFPGDPVATTGPDGGATVRERVTWPNESYRAGSRDGWLDVQPTLPEEAPPRGSAAHWVVLPSRVVLTAHADVSGGTVRVTGEARELDQAASEARFVAAEDVWDTSKWVVTGRPVGRAPVHVVVTDEWWVRIPTGRGYDFIRKRAFETYRYESRSRTLAETDLMASAAGTIRLDVARAFGADTAPVGHSYSITLSAQDPAGRRVDAYGSASAPASEIDRERDTGGLSFEQEWAVRYAPGSTVQIPLTLDGAPAPTGGVNRYLYLTASRGLTSARVSSSPVLLHAFGPDDIPNAGIVAVWFTGSTYLTTYGTVRFDTGTRALDVRLTPDRARYEPGGTVRLSVRTATTDGTGIPATVVIRGIDERLYAMGAAYSVTSEWQVYQEVGEGLGEPWASHRTPAYRTYGQGGDTTGGGGDGPRPRADFRDAVVFQRVTTDANGRGSLTFTLADDITSWRISGAGFTGDLRVGDGTVSIPVGLPMFIEAPVAPSYLASDRPTVMLRAYGSGLTASSKVTFTVSAPSLGMAPTTVTAPAFTPVGVALPVLRVGEHGLRIDANATGASGSRLSDALVRTLHVVASRFTRTTSAFVVLPAPLPAVTTSGFATYIVSDAGRGRYLAPLETLASGGGDRVDEALSALIARDVLQKAFGVDPGESGGYQYSLGRYLIAPSSTSGDRGLGVALLPYASPDLALSARVALLAPGRFDAGSLAEYFTFILNDAASTRERKTIALAGLVGVSRELDAQVDGQRVAEAMAALRTPGLSVRETLYLALAAAMRGDHGAALAAERSLVARYGQRLGPWLRLNVGDDAAILEATSLLALVGVIAGDPLADAAEAYVADHRSTEDLYELQQATFLRAAVDRSPVGPARFAYVLGGVRRTIELSPGASHWIELAPSQRATFSITPLAGRVGVTVRSEEPVAPASVAVDPSLRLVRSMTPASPVPAGSVVTVVLTPTFGSFRIGGCYRVVDVAPSGLQPLSWAYGGTHGSEDVTPWEIVGQKVVFCASPSSARPPRLVYFARVVTPGTYTWEPAIMQASRATERGALTSPQQVVIR